MPSDVHRAWLGRVVPTAFVVVLAGSPAAAASAVDVVPTLTSTPFGAAPGQSVKHTITLSAAGAGQAAGVRVTFTTTVGLDDVRASVRPGSCPTVTAQRVVCELGNVDFSTAAAPEVTITGTVQSATTPGALVQNLVNVTSQQSDADPDNNAVSNAYLVPGATRTPGGEPTSDPNATSRTGKEEWTTSNSVSVVALLVLGGLAAASLIFVRRRRRQR